MQGIELSSFNCEYGFNWTYILYYREVHKLKLSQHNFQNLIFSKLAKNIQLEFRITSLNKRTQKHFFKTSKPYSEAKKFSWPTFLYKKKMMRNFFLEYVSNVDTNNDFFVFLTFNRILNLSRVLQDKTPSPQSVKPSDILITDSFYYF